MCDVNNTKIAALERELDFGRTTIMKWKKSTPNVEALRRVAEYFHTSVDYLIGMEEISTTASEIMNDKDMISIQRAREKMDEGERERMMQLLKLSFAKNFEDNH